MKYSVTFNAEEKEDDKVYVTYEEDVDCSQQFAADMVEQMLHNMIATDKATEAAVSLGIHQFLRAKVNDMMKGE